MSQSLSKLYVHAVFHVKNESIAIHKEDRDILYAYIGTVLKYLQSVPIMIGGTGNHVHVLCVMSKNIALAKLMEDIKRHSSRWVKNIGEHYRSFSWQGGYATFSVSQSLVERTKKYIENQEEHHKRINFQEELILFLKEYNIDYNENYLWTN